MSVVTEFTVSADQFALGRILDVEGGPEIRLESLIPTDRSIVPYLWVASDDANTIKTALEESEIVEEIAIVEETPSDVLFRVGWTDSVDGLIELIGDSDAALLAAGGRGDRWSFRIRFPTRDALSEFYQSCLDSGYRPEIEEVNSPFSATEDGGYSVSEAQQEVLLTALEQGYFDVPRGINLKTIAAELGISDTATSQRIRRGTKTLLNETLARQERTEHTDTERT